ncbi:MAG: SNF2 helicase associated domain-containing protein [Eubacteriaceae bacterium]|nr:SNF2 helicase associated domain-containing protein [Eubacteriaceae bacterium]
MGWEKAFSAEDLEKGKEIFLKDNVVITEKDDGSYHAMVSDGAIYNAYIFPISGSILTRFRAQCNCGEYTSQRACRHIAAALWAIGDSLSKETERLSFLEEPASGGPLRYFDVREIFSHFRYTPAMLREALRLLDDPSSEFSGIRTFFSDYDMTLNIRSSARFPSGTATLQLARDHIVQHVCRCGECLSRAWYSYTLDECPHTLALLIHTLEEIVRTNPGDETDYSGAKMMDSFLSLDTDCDESGARGPAITLSPRLMLDESGISAQFRVAAETTKSYIIKDLSDFLDGLMHSRDMTFGKETVISLRKELLDESSLKLLEFISSCEEDERMFRSRIPSYYAQNRKGMGQNLVLYGSRLERFFELIRGRETEAKITMGSPSLRRIKYIRTEDKDPPVTLKVRPRETDGDEPVTALICSISSPVLFHGSDRVYWLDESGRFNRSEDGYLRRLNSFFPDAEDSIFLIGRKKLSSFFHNVLPRIRQHFNVEISGEERIRSCLSPASSIVFYLDSDEGVIECRIKAAYGDEIFDVSAAVEDGLRDSFREQQAINAVKKYLPVYSQERGCFIGDGDEDKIYELLMGGIDLLNTIGEVRATDSFSSIRLNRKITASVGVSVSSGIMQLDITTDDLSRMELREVLESYRARKKYHRLSGGDFISLEDESVEALSEMLDDLNISLKDFVEGKMEIPSYRALYVDRMLREHEGIYAQRDSRFRKIIDDFRSVGDAEFAIPGSVEGIMRKYQKEGFRWLRTLETAGFGGILADDMGLGKTLQILSVILSAKEEGRLGRALVVCPASLVFNWGEEIRRFTPELSFRLITGTKAARKALIAQSGSCDVLITSYDLIKRDIELYEGLEFTYEILDEAQYIKNQTTSGAKTVKLIRADHRFALTGTPIENRLSELWSIFDFLMPGFLYRYDEFRNVFEAPIVKYDDGKAFEKLRTMCSPFILRRLKEDVLRDLPDKIERTVYAELGTDQRKLYDAQVLRLMETLEEDENFNKKRFEILTQLLRLRQICCAPSLCYENYEADNAKLSTCMQLVESAVDASHKMLIFSQFTSMLDIIRDELDKRKVGYYLLTGSTPKEMRVDLVNAFNRDDTPVFLISLKAGGTGLNLTGADMVIHYDPWWNVAVQNQATDRAHRIGQTRNVTVFRLIAKDTIEEKIEQLQNTKRELADNILSGENIDLASMSREELMSVIGY